MTMRALVALACGLLGCLSGPRTVEAQRRDVEPALRLHTLERLYSYPRLIGTAPSSFVWSADSRRVAFLWNDEGRELRDVWLVDVGDPRPRRLTRLPQPPPPPDGASDIAAIERALATERLGGASGVQWHPDGRRLLFAFEGTLHIVEPRGQPRTITIPGGVPGQFSLSPDGRLLSFLRGGRLWVGALRDDSIAMRAIGPSADTAMVIQSFRWSPDSRSVAFVQFDRSDVPLRRIPDYLDGEPRLVSVPRPYPGEEPGRRRVGVADAGTGAVRWVELDGDPRDLIFTYAWSPDGRTIAIDRSDLFVHDRRILLADSRSGSARLLYREQDTLNATAQWQLEWAPDGGGLYFLSDRDEDYHIYHIALGGGAPSRITSGAWAVFSFQVSGAANTIILVGNRGRAEERHLFRVGLRGGEVTRVSELPGNHAPVVSPDGRRAAVRFSNDDTPPDLYLATFDGLRREERRITHSPLPGFDEYSWVSARYVTFPSHVDGTLLHGRLIVPPDFDPSQRYPAVLGSVYSNTVLNQWGGRTAHPNWGMDQYLAQQGFVILQVDVRGSAGHGRAYRRGIRLGYGGIDVEDLHSGVIYLGTLGWVDTARVGIWGSSYGGLLTAMSLFRKPGVYRAGIAAAPATNVRHALTGEMRVMESPELRPEAYDRASAVNFAAGLEDHLLILHGMRDRIVLFHDSMVLLHRLILMDKPVDVVVLPDAQHAWTQEGSPQVRYAYRQVAEYLKRHVRDRPADDAGAPERPGHPARQSSEP